MIPPIHYKVRVRLQKARNNFTGEEELEQVEKIFIDDNPIQARRRALTFFESYLSVISQKMGLEYNDIRAAHAYMRDLFDLGPRSFALNKGLMLGQSLKYATVEMIIDSPVDDEDSTTTIFELSSFECGHNDTIGLLLNLGKELNYYNDNRLDKGDLEISVNAYDGDDDDVQNYPILAVPLSWEGMDLRPDRIKETNEILLELIEGGENEMIEFKPTLIYNFSSKSFKFPLSQKIPQTICAFLNSQTGGLLFIGVRDSGEIQGLQHDYSLSDIPNTRDYFLQQFNKMLTLYFKPFVRAHIDSSLRKISGREIFIVKVRPATAPVFMTYKTSEGLKKQFFARGSACSNEVIEIEDILQYCLARFSKAKDFNE